MQRPPTFPDPRTADESGLVAVTRTLGVDLLLEAYSRGIFPWSERPVRWFSPDPRAIFLRELIQLPRRVGRIMRKHDLHVTLDTAFEDVMRYCAATHLDDGLWITPGFVRVYGELHHMGYAHSVEVWQGSQLVGGLYGVQLGGLFAGESMFHLVPDASKVAFAHLVAQLDIVGTVLFDCQVINDHTERLGAVCIPREDYLAALPMALAVPTRFGRQKWPAEPPPPAKRTTETGEITERLRAAVRDASAGARTEAPDDDPGGAHEADPEQDRDQGGAHEADPELDG